MAHFIFLGGSEMRPTSWAACRNALREGGHSSRVIDWVKAPWKDGPSPALEDISRQIEDAEEAVLVGHSAASLFLSHLAEKVQARGEIYLAALVAHPGQNFLDRIFAGEEIFTPEWETTYQQILATKKKASDEKLRAMIEPFLFHDCPSDSFTEFWRPSLALDVLYEMRFPEAGNSTRRRDYLVCREDRTIRPEWQRRAAAEILPIKSEPLEFPSGHCPHLAKPKELAGLLIKLAEQGD